MDLVELPAGLQVLTFGEWFNQGLEHLTLPEGLQCLTFSDAFDQTLERVKLPGGLRCLTFGTSFSRDLDQTSFPASLQSLIFQGSCTQNFEDISLPSNLESLSLGYLFNQKLQKIKLPAGLKTLILGEAFNETLEGTSLPDLENLSLWSMIHWDHGWWWFGIWGMPWKTKCDNQFAQGVSVTPNHPTISAPLRLTGSHSGGEDRGPCAWTGGHGSDSCCANQGPLDTCSTRKCTK